MTHIRHVALALALVLLPLSACKDGSTPGIPVNITIPPAVLTFVTDADAIMVKVAALAGTNTEAVAAVKKAQTYLDDLLAGKGDPKALVGGLAGVLGIASGFLPPPYNLAAGVLVGLMNAYAGKTALAARRAGPTMTPEQALAILRS